MLLILCKNTSRYLHTHIYSQSILRYFLFLIFFFNFLSFKKNWKCSSKFFKKCISVRNNPNSHNYIFIYDCTDIECNTIPKKHKEIGNSHLPFRFKVRNLQRKNHLQKSQVSYSIWKVYKYSINRKEPTIFPLRFLFFIGV